jgi:hypothetical protein
MVQTGGSDGFIASGQILSGAIIPSAVKAHRFFGQVGERVVVGFAKASGNTSYSKNIYLYPPNSAPVEASSGGYNTLLSARLKETGTYMVVVCDQSLNNSFDYNVSLVKNSGPFSSLESPGGGGLISGQTGSGNMIPGVVKGYYFYGLAGERAIIGFSEASGGTTYSKNISLYPPSGGPAEANSGGYNTSLSHQLSESGLYMACFYDQSLNDSYEYNVSLVKIPDTLPLGLYNPRPGDANTRANARGNFTWTPVAGATGYDLYFGNNIFQSLSKIGNNLPTASLPLPNLDWGQVYYWRVVAHTNSGDMTGPIWWFVPRSGNIVPVLDLLLQ